MNKLFLLLFVTGSIVCKAQETSVNANQQKIEEIKSRINNIESQAGVKPNDCSEQTMSLNKRIIRLEDSLKHVTHLYTEMLMNSNMSALKKYSFFSGDCNCIRILHGINKTSIEAEDLSKLDSLAMLVENKKEYKIIMVGHADQTGSNADNVQLSKNRAVAVRNHLVNVKKLKAEWLEIDWEGSSIPVVEDDGKHHMNRRTEIFVTFK